MPICGRIKDFHVTQEGGSPHLQVTVGDFSDDIPFKDYVQCAFPKVKISPTQRSRTFLINAPASDITDLERLLSLLKTSVTILDTANESHALSMHKYVDKAKIDRIDNGRTYYGKLVRVSKSYARGGGDYNKALELVSHMVQWVKSHPTYARVDAVAAIPPSNPDKDHDLPEMIAAELSRVLSLRVISITSTNTAQQKALDHEESDVAIAGAFSMSTDLRGLHVMLVDDIYHSGRTMAEGVRVLRAAGAKAVFSLAATKTLRDVDGLWAYLDNWEEVPETLMETSANEDLPFE